MVTHLDDKMAAADRDEVLLSVPAELVIKCKGLAYDIGVYNHIFI